MARLIGEGSALFGLPVDLPIPPSGLVGLAEEKLLAQPVPDAEAVIEKLTIIGDDELWSTSTTALASGT